MYRAGGVAAALALAVSGGAYAAVQATGPDARPMTESQARLQDLADNSAPDVDDSAPAADESPELPVEGDQSSMTTVTEDVTDAHTSTQEETDSLPQGQTQVKTAGVDGVSRVTYQVTMRDGQEVSREAVSSVVVTQRVDEVVLVGDVRDAAEGDVVAGFGEDAGTGDDPAIGDRVGRRHPFEPRPEHPHEQPRQQQDEDRDGAGRAPARGEEDEAGYCGRDEQGGQSEIRDEPLDVLVHVENLGLVLAEELRRQCHGPYRAIGAPRGAADSREIPGGEEAACGAVGVRDPRRRTPGPSEQGEDGEDGEE